MDRGEAMGRVRIVIRPSLCVASLLTATLLSGSAAADTIATVTTAAPAVVVHYSAATATYCAQETLDNHPYTVNGTTINFGDAGNSYYVGGLLCTDGVVSQQPWEPGQPGLGTVSGDYTSVPDSSLFGYGGSPADFRSENNMVHYASRNMTMFSGTVGAALAAALPGWTYAIDGLITLSGSLDATNMPGCPLEGPVDVYTGQEGYNAFPPPEGTSVGTNVTLNFNVSAFSAMTGTTVTLLIDVTFAAVSGSGATQVTAASYVPGTLSSDFSLSGGGYQAEFFDVSTTAAVTGPITVCQHYNDVDNNGIVDGTSVSETDLRMMHGEGDPVVFVDRTSSLDVTNNIICGQVSSLSPFVVALFNSPTATPTMSPVATATTPPAVPTSVAGDGCADGTREGLIDSEQFPDIAACSGSWSGHVANGATLCASGWDVCTKNSPQVRAVTFAAATAFTGCFAFNAADDFDHCLDCIGTYGYDDMAGMGSDCPYKSPTSSSCLASGRIDVACCSDNTTGTACQFKPGLTTGAVCCRSSTAIPTLSQWSIVTLSCLALAFVLWARGGRRRLRAT